MTAPNVQEITQAVLDALDRRREISEAQHIEDHNFIRNLIHREERRGDFWRDLHSHVLKWGALSLLSVLGYALWIYIRQQIQAP